MDHWDCRSCMFYLHFHDHWDQCHPCCSNFLKFSMFRYEKIQNDDPKRRSQDFIIHKIQNVVPKISLNIKSKINSFVVTHKLGTAQGSHSLVAKNLHTLSPTPSKRDSFSSPWMSFNNTFSSFSFFRGRTIFLWAATAAVSVL